MNSEIQERLLVSLYACLRPIARVLLRYGITYRQFADISKAAFIREAFSETDSRGRRLNASRVAVKTGISRKEVSRLRDAIKTGSAMEGQNQVDHSGPPARVLHAWHTNPKFVDEEGVPRALAFEGSEPNFTTLVKSVAGDVPPGAVRAELRRAGAIAEMDDGLIVATKRYFVPGTVDEKAITVISNLLFPVAAGIDHNSNPDRKTEGYIQRFAFSERLAAESVPVFRKWSRGEATRFIETMDDWLAGHEMDSEAEETSEPGKIAGIGVFYYEGPEAEESTRS